MWQDHEIASSCGRYDTAGSIAGELPRCDEEVRWRSLFSFPLWGPRRAEFALEVDRRRRSGWGFRIKVVVPGHAKRELRCAIAHRRISRFRVWFFGPSRNDSARLAQLSPHHALTGRLAWLVCGTPRLSDMWECVHSQPWGFSWRFSWVFSWANFENTMVARPGRGNGLPSS